VTLLDVNDNRPLLSLPDYDKTIYDTLSPANVTVLQVSATDRDAGVNAQISYRFIGNSTATSWLCFMFPLGMSDSIFSIIDDRCVIT